jgi:glycosyltransferase involved in cell wall biosynthesis
VIRWHIVTGEYPPQFGGVSDYSRLLARGLAQAGDAVDVWAPACFAAAAEDEGVAVHRLPGHFGPRALALLDRALRRDDAAARLLVQYVPHMYGCKAMNVPFCAWLWSRARPAPWIMFHEVAFPMAWRQPLRRNVLGAAHRLMAVMAARSAARIFVAIPQWEERLKSLVSIRCPIAWLPIPSNLPTHVDEASAHEVRCRLLPGGEGSLVGHFGTFGASTVQMLERLLPNVLGTDPRRIGLLLGRGAAEFAESLRRSHPALQDRLHACGNVPADVVARHLAACDVLLQPFIDGVSSRRTSLMASLALGKAIVTTRGPATEPVWQENHLVEMAELDDIMGLQAQVERLLADPAARQTLAEQARLGYERFFSLRRTIDVLRQAV